MFKSAFYIYLLTCILDIYTSRSSHKTQDQVYRLCIHLQTLAFRHILARQCRTKCWVETKPEKVYIPSQSAPTTACSVLRKYKNMRYKFNIWNETLEYIYHTTLFKALILTLYWCMGGSTKLNKWAWSILMKNCHQG